MEAERWRRIDKLCSDVLEQDPADRAAFLDRACAEDPSLKKDVEKVLGSLDDLGSFLVSPAVGATAVRNQTGTLVGRTIGRYEILASVGAGGMGEVYRAHDSRLSRDVALKVLPAKFSADPQRVRRSEREAKLLASLNHPNIAAIYDLEESDGIRCLILEFVDGQTLADRIKRGRLPLAEVLEISRQIAEALEAAHEQGIVHRDLKPANIMMTANGRVKVLDFGIAKMLEPQTGEDAPTNVDSVSAGVVLGTPAYMSPEQARGQTIDKRTDAWAFGCVLYEMLTGCRAFDGQTAGEILAEVLKSEPNWQRLPAQTPAGIRRLLLRCLRKNPKGRLRDLGDAGIEIAEAQTSPAAAAETDKAHSPSRMKERLAWIAVVIFALLGGVAAVRFSNTAPALPETRADIATAPTYFPSNLELSPDGRKIAYVAEAGSGPQVWVRSLDSGSAKVLPGTNSGASLYVGPFWAPDNRSVGFFADNKLKVVDTESGSIRILANAPNPRGGTWNQKDVILFVPFSPGPIYRMSASGGKPEPVTKVEEGVFHQFPQFLPDGQHFIFYVQGDVEKRGVYVSSVNAGDGSKPVRLFDADSAAVYSPSEHLLFLQKGKLTAQPFDVKRLSLSGNPFTVAEDIATGLNRAAISASAAGPIVYRANEPPDLHATPKHFAWFDRTGREVAPFDDPLVLNIHWYLGLDDRSFAQEQIVKGTSHIWRLDLVRGVRNQITTNPAYDMFPVLSPNGQRIVFTSNRKGPTYDLYVTSADRIGGETLLFESKENKIGTDWSADGRFLLYRNFSADTGYDVWALPFDENGNKSGDPIAVTRTAADERDGQFSPDGKWVAYQSNDTGSFEIYVQPFPGPGTRYLVSRGGGTQVRWNRNGKELFYVSFDGRLMSVPIRFDAGQHIEADAPVAMFLTSMRGADIQSGNRQQYAVSADGQRILMRADALAPNNRPLTLILNWKPKQQP